MRKLNCDDLFLVSAIIDKMNIELPKAGENETQQEYGMKLIMLISRKLYKAKDEVKELVSNVSGKDAKDLSILELKDIVIELFKTEGFASFFN